MASYLISDAVRFASSLTGYTPQSIIGKSRMRVVVRVRFAVYLVAHEIGHSYPNIGKYIGGRDHSTVIYGVQQARLIAERDAKFAKLIADLRSRMADGEPFSSEITPIEPVVLPPLPKKRVMQLRPVINRDEVDPDSGVTFHLGIASGSDKLAAAIALARA